jgi:transcription elongation factor/antiterminator RfaH
MRPGGKKKMYDGLGVDQDVAGRRSGGRCWYVVKCIARREALAEQQLSRQNFQTFLPLIVSSSNTTRGTGISRQSAFFPGYLFVRLDLSVDRWRSVNGTFGVSSLVSVGGRPTAMPDGMIEQFVERTNEFGELGFEDHLKPGRVVRVVGGPFNSWLGTFAGLDGPGRVRVLLDMMGRPVAVSLLRGSVMTV